MGRVSQVRFLFFFCILAGAITPALAQQPNVVLPVVTAAGTPDYPTSAQNMRIQGAVRVRVSIGGGKVTWVQVEDGPPMLWRPSEAYVRTWQFRNQEPGNFLVTLQYSIEQVKLCGPSSVAYTTHFPYEVDIIAKDTKSCDIVATVLARNQPVTIKFDVQLNGESLPPPSAVNLNLNGQPLTLSVQNSQFTVPLDAVRAKSVAFSLSLPNQEITTNIDGANFALENWTLRLADKSFGEDFQYDVPKGAKVKFACVLTFDSMYVSAGSYSFDPHCRTIQKPGK